MKRSFDDIEYRISHGTSPKGGKGTWAIATSRKADIDEVWFFYGTLTEVKKMACAKAKELGIPGDKVLYILG